MREMLAPEGGFCSTQDADSEDGDGKVSVWTPTKSATSWARAEAFMTAYGVTRLRTFPWKSDVAA